MSSRAAMRKKLRKKFRIGDLVVDESRGLPAQFIVVAVDRFKVVVDATPYYRLLGARLPFGCDTLDLWFAPASADRRGPPRLVRHGPLCGEACPNKWQKRVHALVRNAELPARRAAGRALVMRRVPPQTRRAR